MVSQQKAINGFAICILASMGMAIYLVWMFLPDPLLRAVQFTYYPDKYWGVALPAALVMAFLFFWCSYMISYCRNTRKLTSVITITDPHAKPEARASLGGLSETAKSSVPPITDIPVHISSKILHQSWR